MKARKDTLTIVVSTMSGTRLAQDFYYNVLLPLLNWLGLVQNIHFEAYQTISTESIHRLTETIFWTNAGWNETNVEQNIILLSGDGGVSDIINGLLKSDPQPSDKNWWRPPVINLIPMGTGNALANSSGIIGSPGDEVSKSV